MQGIKKPTLLIDRNKALANISSMLSKGREHGAVLRPHFKTHQLPEVGQWFRDAGVDRIAVSSVSMARLFAEAGWKDILITFPVNFREMEEINELAANIHLGLTISAPGIMPLLVKTLKAPAKVWLKIDVGTHRTGFDPEEIDLIRLGLKSAREHPQISVAGLLAHAGHTYQAATSVEILNIHQESMKLLNGLREALGDVLPHCLISWGDTPSCSIANTFYGADELRPGNFVYYDLMQQMLGACGLEDIAVVVAAPVVVIHPSRNEMVVYAGAVHLSKEQGCDRAGNTHFGQLVLLDSDKGWIFTEEPCYVQRISQEHGVVRLSLPLLHQVELGDLVGILPVHSCLTADLLRRNTCII